MANDPHDSSRLPGPGERIRRLAQTPVPTGGDSPRGGQRDERRAASTAGAAGTAQMAFAGAPHDAHAGHGAAGHGPASAHGADAHGHHPTAGMYVMIGIILTIITAVEVSAYYIPAWETSAIYVPSMLLLSAVKFTIVVMFYMHLKYDHKLFRALFSGPFVIAFATMFGLMFLFGKLAIRLGLLS